MVSFYRLSLLTMLLTEALQVFGGADSTHIWEKMGVLRGSEFVPHGSGQTSIFACSGSFLVRCTIQLQYICDTKQ